MNILFLTSAAPDKGPIPTSEKRPPLGVGYLMAVLKKEGHNVFFSDEYLKPSDILNNDFLKENNERLHRSAWIISRNPPLNTEIQILLDRAESPKRKIVQNLDDAKEWVGVKDIIIE